MSAKFQKFKVKVKQMKCFFFSMKKN